MTYDFTTLAPEDFESLVGDLLSREWGSQLEAFKKGRDDGIDLRHSTATRHGSTTVVQCKRFAPDSFPRLKNAMGKEVAKIAKLAPSRYVLATSVRLSPKNKDDLVRQLHPYLLGPEDVYGPSELNGLLRKYPGVERAHFKLWISSTAVLEQILHARIFNVTQQTIDEVQNQMCRLVVHRGFAKASQLLKDHHHCVIAGNPGIGKTTLARMLLCDYIKDGFTPLVVTSDISDAASIIRTSSAPDKKYVVLYDDFLGTVGFDQAKFSKNEDSSLISFVSLVRRTNNVRLIMTTREYILADAKRLHGAFAKAADHLAKCTLLIEDYALSSRAQMFFNHLFFSDLPDVRRRQVVDSKIYRSIVKHRNFNPRVVETVCVNASSRHVDDNAFLAYLERQFDDPSELWEHPFTEQISLAARELLVLLWTFGGRVDTASLRTAYFALTPTPSASDASIRFTNALKEIHGNFVTSNRYRRSRQQSDFVFVVQFQNPEPPRLYRRLFRLSHAAMADSPRVA